MKWNVGAHSRHAGEQVQRGALAVSVIAYWQLLKSSFSRRLAAHRVGGEARADQRGDSARWAGDEHRRERERARCRDLAFDPRVTTFRGMSSPASAQAVNSSYLGAEQPGKMAAVQREHRRAAQETEADDQGDVCLERWESGARWRISVKPKRGCPALVAA